ncbi:MAG: hypothetical protein ACPGJV_08015 [Bacteriovoracaceae bacterium]
MKLIQFITITLLFLSGKQAFSQSVVDQLTQSNQVVQTGPGDLVTERILKISHSRRVFILTNQSQTLFKGDFISLLIDQELAVRAIVAKNNSDQIGIKIVKIYSLTAWEKINTGVEVQILKGDDSFFKKTEDEDIDSTVIKTEEDLFNSTLLDEDVDLEDKTNRVIKTDNIISANYGLFEAYNGDRSANTYAHFNGTWAYQFADNVWIEGQFGQNTVDGFPSTDLTTSINTYTFRLKYIISAPFYSYVMPYVGYQNVQVNSNGAGSSTGRTLTGSDGNELTNASDIQNALDEENAVIALTEDLSGLVFGATILKRFVPGWFFRVDLGSDIINFGLAVEF